MTFAEPDSGANAIAQLDVPRSIPTVNFASATKNYPRAAAP
jgi:hypothetical protein